jgi:hypothetical protein
VARQLIGGSDGRWTVLNTRGSFAQYQEVLLTVPYTLTLNLFIDVLFQLIALGIVIFLRQKY